MHGWKKLLNIFNTHLHCYNKQDQFFKQRFMSLNRLISVYIIHFQKSKLNSRTLSAMNNHDSNTFYMNTIFNQ